MATRRFLALAAAAVLAAACGGSGGDGPTSPGGLPVELVEAESFDLVNQARRQQNVRPDLSFEDALAAVARQHSEAMRDEGFFGHRGPSGMGLVERLRAAGIRFRSAGENLAQVNHRTDPAGAAHQNFMASANHRDNILDQRFDVAAVGVANSGNLYWVTQIFVER